MTLLIADRIEAALHEEIVGNDMSVRSLLEAVDDTVLANSVRALLKERDQRSPHFLLAFALRSALDHRVNVAFIPRYEAARRVA